jgi:hypothetical protein
MKHKPLLLQITKGKFGLHVSDLPADLDWMPIDLNETMTEKNSPEPFKPHPDHDTPELNNRPVPPQVQGIRKGLGRQNNPQAPLAAPP